MNTDPSRWHQVTLRLRAYDPVDPVIDGEQIAPPSDACTVRQPHLTWWFVVRPGEVEAHYHFDEVYLRAHPEALDVEHLTMLAALLTFKLFDDGDVLVDTRQLVGVLRWPALDERPRPLTARNDTNPNEG